MGGLLLNHSPGLLLESELKMTPPCLETFFGPFSDVGRCGNYILSVQLLAAHHPALISDLRVLYSPVSLVLLVGSGPLLEHFLVSPNDSGWEVL